MDQDAIGTEVGLCPGHIVLDGAQLPPKEHGPRFSAHVFCGENGRPSQLLLSTCFTAHGRVSLYFTMDHPFPLEIVLPLHEGSGPHLVSYTVP